MLQQSSLSQSLLLLSHVSGSNDGQETRDQRCKIYQAVLEDCPDNRLSIPDQALTDLWPFGLVWHVLALDHSYKSLVIQDTAIRSQEIKERKMKSWKR
jgi:hypothetical protein